MKTMRWAVWAGAWLWMGSSAMAQGGFESGSNGALGDVVITNDTQMLLPPDGRLHFKSFAVRQGATLSFLKNANNTPVYLLSQGDVLIAGVIGVDGGWGNQVGPGLGGPGGFDGGRRGAGPNPAGDGHGPGAGRIGDASSVDRAQGPGGGAFLDAPVTGSSTNHGRPYGNAALIPLIGGSGGAGNNQHGGGGGGGAILIASSTKVEFAANSGWVYARGGRYGGSTYSSGSGGAIKIVAPLITGPVRTEVYSFGVNGGAGRIRLDAINYAGARFEPNPAYALSYGSMLVTGLEGTLPQLSVMRFAGRDLTTNAVPIILPNGSSTNQPITIQARNFGTRLPVQVVVAPDHGETISVPAEIDNVTGNPGQTTLNVPVPANVPVRVFVWTR